MVAVDLGGTEIKAAVVAPDGRVLHRVRRPTGRERGGAAVVDTVVETAAALVARCPEVAGAAAVAVGVVVPGMVDEAAGRAVWSANLGWRDLPLRDLLTERLGLPVAFGHDVRAGGLAEGVLGAARGRGDFLFVALGTGVAAAYVVDGRAVRGAHGGAGELGHLVVRRRGPRCGCGNRGCLETLASASALARRYTSASAATGEPRTPVTAERVCRLAQDGDPVAVRVWNDAVTALADGLAVCATLYDTSLVVIGGGLSRAGAALFDPLRSALAARLTFQPTPTLLPATLGPTAGTLGAALLALNLKPTPPGNSPPSPPGV
ncbi:MULTISPECIES: ROK family protein [unclassified Streptomyces]|uniref:ROK family protein n=1 Tax=unclassified Streptomyces TaxID=2593676 RepID=UPI002E2A17D4|nr:ROK family protein [Streptomyces sp. NBC_00223]